jgi:hypothetical protein
MITKKEMTAPCGLDRFNGERDEENLAGKLARLIHDKLGVPENKIACKGCREQDGAHYHLSKEGCATLDWVTSKGVSLCCDCSDFSCALLAPTADGAARYPHNMKVYNLCRINRVGLDR